MHVGRPASAGSGLTQTLDISVPKVAKVVNFAKHDIIHCKTLLFCMLFTKFTTFPSFEKVVNFANICKTVVFYNAF